MKCVVREMSSLDSLGEVVHVDFTQRKPTLHSQIITMVYQSTRSSRDLR
jgi:hypothetical protein